MTTAELRAAIDVLAIWLDLDQQKLQVLYNEIDRGYVNLIDMLKLRGVTVEDGPCSKS